MAEKKDFKFDIKRPEPKKRNFELKVPITIRERERNLIDDFLDDTLYKNYRDDDILRSDNPTQALNDYKQIESKVKNEDPKIANAIKKQFIQEKENQYAMVSGDDEVETERVFSGPSVGYVEKQVEKPKIQGLTDEEVNVLVELERLRPRFAEIYEEKLKTAQPVESQLFSSALYGVSQKEESVEDVAYQQAIDQMVSEGKMGNKLYNLLGEFLYSAIPIGGLSERQQAELMLQATPGERIIAGGSGMLVGYGIVGKVGKSADTYRKVTRGLDRYLSGVSYGKGSFKVGSKLDPVKGRAIAETLGRASSSAQTFGTYSTLDAISDEKLSNAEKVERILTDATLGVGLGATGTIASPFKRIPAEGLVGFTSGLLESGDPKEASLNALIFMGFGLLNRQNLKQNERTVLWERLGDDFITYFRQSLRNPNLTKEQRVEAKKIILKELRKIKANATPDELRNEIESVKKQILYGVQKMTATRQTEKAIKKQIAGETTRASQELAKKIKKSSEKVPETGTREVLNKDNVLKMSIDQQVPQLKELGFTEDQLVKIGGEDRANIIANAIKPVNYYGKEQSKPKIEIEQPKEPVKVEDKPEPVKKIIPKKSWKISDKEFEKYEHKVRLDEFEEIVGKLLKGKKKDYTGKEVAKIIKNNLDINDKKAKEIYNFLIRSNRIFRDTRTHLGEGKVSSYGKIEIVSQKRIKKEKERKEKIATESAQRKKEDDAYKKKFLWEQEQKDKQNALQLDLEKKIDKTPELRKKLENPKNIEDYKEGLSKLKLPGINKLITQNQVRILESIDKKILVNAFDRIKEINKNKLPKTDPSGKNYADALISRINLRLALISKDKLNIDKGKKNFDEKRLQENFPIFKNLLTGDVNSPRNLSTGKVEDDVVKPKEKPVEVSEGLPTLIKKLDSPDKYDRGDVIDAIESIVDKFGADTKGLLKSIGYPTDPKSEYINQDGEIVLFKDISEKASIVRGRKKTESSIDTLWLEAFKPKPLKTKKPVESNLVELDPKQVKIDESKFQPREEYNQSVIDDIANNFNASKWDPPVLWQDPKSKDYFVVSGHHRQQGVVKGGIDDAMYKVLPEGTTLAQAKNFAGASNLQATGQSEFETAAEIRRRIEEGDSYDDIASDMPGLFKNVKDKTDKLKKIKKLAYLDPKGKFKENFDNPGFYKIISKARQIANFRERHDWFTDKYEDDVFTYLYKEGGESKNDIDYDTHLNKIIEKLNDQKDKPESIIKLLRKEPSKPAENTHTEVLKVVDNLKAQVKTIEAKLNSKIEIEKLVNAQLNGGTISEHHSDDKQITFQQEYENRLESYRTGESGSPYDFNDLEKNRISWYKTMRDAHDVDTIEYRHFDKIYKHWKSSPEIEKKIKNDLKKELRQVKKELMDLIDKTNAPDPNQAGLFQDVKSFGSKSSAFKKWFGDSKVVDENGKPLVVYHGTTQNFDIFDIKKSEAEADLGGGFYFTSSARDVNRNYGTRSGPDLKNKLERKAEQDPEYTSGDDLDIDYKVRLRTHKNLIVNDGNVMPVYLSMQNPVDLGEKGTFIEPSYTYNEELDEYEDDYDSIGMKIINAIEMNNLTEWKDTQKIMGAVSELMMDGIYAKDLIKGMKGIDEIAYIDGEDGNLLGNQFISDVFAEAGFDGFILPDADKRFNNMGMPEGTTHYVVFEPTQIKSQFNKGTFDPKDPSILMQSLDQYNMFGGMDKIKPVNATKRAELDVILDELHRIKLERDFLEKQKADKKINAIKYKQQISKLRKEQSELEIQRIKVYGDSPQTGLFQSVGAYHGSPHTFKKFKMSAMGTGEGVQAYGYGLYFSDKKEIANFYAESLGGLATKNYSIGGIDLAKNEEYIDYSPHVLERQWWKYKPYIRPSKRQPNYPILNDVNDLSVIIEDLLIFERNFNNTSGESNEVIKGKLDDYFNDQINSTKEDMNQEWNKEYKDEFVGKIRILELLQESVKKDNFNVELAKTRNVYKVKLKSQDPNKMNWLDWEDPISPEISEKLYAIFKDIKEGKTLIGGIDKEGIDLSEWKDDLGLSEVYFGDYITGRQLYMNLTQYLTKSDGITSSFLNKYLGIDGNRFLTERGTGGVTGDKYNYVVFDEEAIEIETHNLYQNMKDWDKLKNPFRPNTNETQKETAKILRKELQANLPGENSLPSRRRRYTIQGNGITEPLARKGFVSLVGTRVSSTKELASVSQILRDPRYETARLFFVKNNKIVHQSAVTSRLPGAVANLFPGDVFPMINQNMKNFEADSFYLLHNHPGGDSKPSGGDLGFTEIVANNYPKSFKGHVVINSNNYSVINKNIKVERHEVDFGKDKLLQPSKPHPWLGTKLSSPEDLEKLGRKIQNRGFITLLNLNNNSSIRGVIDVPVTTFDLSTKKVMATLRDIARKTGSVQSVAVVGGYESGITAKQMDRLMEMTERQAITSVVMNNNGNIHSVIDSKSPQIFFETFKKRRAPKVVMQQPVKKFKSSRQKALARAHILESEISLAEREKKLIKKSITGFESLGQASDSQISAYVDYLLEQKYGNKPISKPTINKKTLKDIREEKLLQGDRLEKSVLERASIFLDKPKDFLGTYWVNSRQSMERTLEKMGKGGQKLARMYREAEYYHSEKVKPLEAEMERLWKKVPTEEKELMRNIIESEGASDLSKNGQAFVDFWGRLTDDIYNEGKKYMNPDLNYIQNYFPLQLKMDFYKEVNPKHKLWDEVVDHVQQILNDRISQADVFTGLNVSREEAEQYTLDFLNYYKTRGLREHFIQQVFKPSGKFKHSYPLEMHRDRIFPEWAYEQDIMNVAHGYIDKSFEAISFAKEFGKIDEDYKYENIDTQLDLIERDGFSRNDAQNIMSWAMGLKNFDEYDQKMNRFAKNLTSYLLSFRTSVKNLTDLGKAFSQSGTIPTLQSVLKLMFNKKERELSRDLIGSQDVFQQSLEKAGIGSGIASFYTKNIIQFTRSEQGVRQIIGHSRILQAEHLLKNYDPGKKGIMQNHIKRMFELVTDGLDIDKIKKRGNLNRSEILRIGNYAIGQTQPASNLDKPINWLSKGFWFRKSIFQSFSHKSIRWLKNFVFKELKHGNMMPLVNLMVWRMTLGLGYQSLVSWFFNDKPTEEEELFDKCWKAFTETGEIGLLADLLFLVQHSGWASPFVSTMFGPKYGVMFELLHNSFKSAHRIKEGKEDPFNPLLMQLGRKTIKKVPFVGQKMYEEQFPKKITKPKKKKVIRRKQQSN